MLTPGGAECGMARAWNRSKNFSS